MNSVLDSPGAAVSSELPALRPLGQILAFEDEDPRFPRMEETWHAFAREMAHQVGDVLGSGRSSAELAYGVGALVHNYFRSRGITLTTYELRALAAELVDTRKFVEPAEPPQLESEAEAAEQEPAAAETPVVAPAPRPPVDDLVSFVGEQDAQAAAWAGQSASPNPTPGAPPIATETVIEAPPSTLVSMVDREASAFDRMLLQVVERAGRYLTVSADGGVDRAQARRAIEAVLDGVLRDHDEPLSPETRSRLAQRALSEICGLGLIDRLWADPSIRAVFVDGPDAVHVDRNGVRERAPETFRSAVHLLEVARRLARPRSAGVVEVRLRDGGSGVVVFPPSAPAGPVLALRRSEPGNATLERLVAAQMLDLQLATLLRVLGRARLNIVVVGPEGAGKTALLVAIARDLTEFRVVTLARHREFRWPSSTKVELVAHVGGPSFADLMTAGARLQPDMLVVDAPAAEDFPGLAARLARGTRGTLAALRPDALAAGLARSAHVTLRLGRSNDGVFRVISLEDGAGTAIFVHDGERFHRLSATPAFAGLVREAGYSEAFSGIFP
jgi:pilus assembly protein CpaF